MLVAQHHGSRIEASDANRTDRYICPHCKCDVILKAGRKVIWHFAHKPPTTCTWAAGETKGHLEGKKYFRDEFVSRSIKAEVEFVVDTLPGDRRADVLIWSPNGQRYAVELQHSNIGLVEIEARAEGYTRAGIAQIWIPFIRSGILEGAKVIPGGLFIEKYVPRLFERWVHGFHGKDGMWMYDPSDKSLWHARMAAHELHVEYSSWYGPGGEEMSSGGYNRTSKKYKELTLKGPFALHGLGLTKKYRYAAALSHYKWPAGHVANLEPKTPAT